MTQGRTYDPHGKDGMFNRFNQQVMEEVCKINRPDVRNFHDEAEASKFLRHFTKLKRFKDYHAVTGPMNMPQVVSFRPVSFAARCTAHAKYEAKSIELGTFRRNPLEVLHILAHYFQPQTSKWHGGEFSVIFLDFVDRHGDADLKREVKDIMLKHRITTYVRGEESRLRQSRAYYDRKVGELPKNLLGILHDIRGLDDELRTDS